MQDDNTNIKFWRDQSYKYESMYKEKLYICELYKSLVAKMKEEISKVDQNLESKIKKKLE